MLRPDSFALIAALGALAALGPLSNDIYLVSLPSMTEAFGASVERVQLTLTAFIVGFAFGQYIYGPLSDRFGRRPLMLVGLVLYIAASFVAASAPTVEVLIAARFFQAIGMNSGPVLGRAVVRDLYDRERAARLLSYMAVIAGFAPVVAPIIGSHLHVSFGWRANFVFVALYGVIALIVVALHFGETNRNPDPEALRPRRMAGNIRTLLSSRLYLGYALTISCVGAGMFAFLSGSPFVFLKVLGFAAADFGYLFSICMSGYLIGSLVSGRFVLRLGMDRLLLLGIALALVGGLSMTLLAALHVSHVAAILVPMFIFMFAFALVLPQAMSGAMTPFPRIAGNAASLVGLCQYGLSAVVGTAVAALFDGTQMPMAGAIGAMAALSALAYATLVRPART